jgi:hypothetical protein
MRLAYSNASFVYAYRSEDSEAFLDGHVRAFEFFGGIPDSVTYDNLKCAVITIGKGQARKRTKSFLELRNYYLFSSRFCNRASGHEKGDVENLVKFAQRNFMTPVPEATSLDELNNYLMTCCHRDMERCSGKSNRPILESFQEEKNTLRPLPEKCFEACTHSSTFVSKFLTVQVDNNEYSVPLEFAYRSIHIKAFVERVEIYYKEQSIAVHKRSYARAQSILEFMHYLPVLERKPGALQHGLPLKGQPWGSIFSQLRDQLRSRYGIEGDRYFIDVLLLLQTHKKELVETAIVACLRNGAYKADAIKTCLSYQAPKQQSSIDMSGRPGLMEVSYQPRSLKIYDRLNSNREEVLA